MNDGHAVEVRLTTAVIRELRPALRADARVELRKGTSDWIDVHVAASLDVAHRTGAGEIAKPAPSGSDLERRRRFH